MKPLITIIGIAAALFTLWFGYQGNASLMATSLMLCLGLLFFANLDRISEFKASAKGIEAKTRERVDKAESDIQNLRALTDQIRKEIDNTPYFIHGRLPFTGQAILRYLYQGETVKVDEFKKQMKHISTPEEVDNVIQTLQRQHGWIENKDGMLSLTQSGAEAVKSYMELTIVRAF